MRTIEKMMYFFNANETQPTDGAIVMVICADGDKHLAKFEDGAGRYDEKSRWYVYGPAGAKRRLQKKVWLWAYTPEISEDEVVY